MSIIVLVVCVVILVFGTLNGKAKAARHLEERKAKGQDDPTNSKLHSRLEEDLEHNWFHEGGTWIPEQYREFLKVHSNARFEYFRAWVAEKEFQAGYRPYSAFDYDKRNFDPFRSWHEMYDEVYEIWKETGRLYRR